MTPINLQRTVRCGRVRAVVGIAAGSLLLASPAAVPAPTQPPLPPGARITDGPPIGSAAEPFALPDAAGHLVRLSDLMDREGGQSARRSDSAEKPAVTMLNFWAFWCDTWNAEMPSLRELSERRQELNFRMAAVSVDGARLAEFQRDTSSGADVPFPVLLDSGGKVSAEYNIHHVPTVILLDREGRVGYCAYGYPGNEVVLNHIRQIINEDARIAPNG